MAADPRAAVLALTVMKLPPEVFEVLVLVVAVNWARDLATDKLCVIYIVANEHCL